MMGAHSIRGRAGKLIKQSLRQEFPGVKKRKEKRRLYRLVSTGATQQLRDLVLADPAVIGSHRKLWLIVDDDVDQYYKHGDNQSRLKEQQLASSFNSGFFTSGDSREPELAGIRGAVVGSFFVILITLGLSLPLGVAAAIYLEEFSRRNRWTDFVEVNINNLAAVPSIVFGLLGLAVFINFFELPRSAPLVGGLVLTLMTLPTIIIASRAALKSVPPSIREAALGMGASKMQAVFHHVLPLAMPGMLTGTIIGLAQALGETAPLLMIGMVAFIVDIPGSIMDPATVLPVQIYLWADSPERAFTEKTSAAIMVLLAFLILMNLLAIWLRRKFERRW
ncbi:phosphate ABC transporter permease PstA [Thiolapillus sp.]|uniref:phosphate ABC transporter permease PstA n=1 Tax=Thiolapillus sp. TaxID=2017437 RepID=UPI003AF8682F